MKPEILIWILLFLLIPDLAQADPVTAVITAATWFFTSTSIWAVAARFVVSFAINALRRPSSRAGGQERQASVLQLNVGEHPREALFGLACTGGSLAGTPFAYGGQYGNDWNVFIIALADHRCASLEGFYVDDGYHAFEGDGMVAGFNNQLEVHWREGTLTQAGLPAHLLAASNGLYTADDRWAGVSIAIVAYKADAQDARYPVWAGRPRFRFVLKGKLCYDPRLDDTVDGGEGVHRWTDPETWEWSENVVVCEYNYRRGIYAGDQVDDPEMLLIGRGLSAVEAPPEAIIAGANLCDEAVALKAGGTEARYRCGGVIQATEDFKTVTDMFASACGGYIRQPEGSVMIVPGEARATVATLSDRDLVVGSRATARPFATKPQRIHTVIPRYVEPSVGWQSHAAPLRRSASAIAEDGGGAGEASLDLQLVTSGTQAQRLGEIALRRGRLERRVSLTLPPRYRFLEEGDWVQYVSPRRWGEADPIFEVVSWSRNEKREITLELAEHEAAVFDWDPETDEITPGSTDETPTDRPGPPIAPDPEDWDLQPRPPVVGGPSQPVVRVTGGSSNPRTETVVFYSGPSSTGPWILAGTATPGVETFDLGGLEPAETVYVAVAYAEQDRGESDKTVLGSVTVPDLVADDVSDASPTRADIDALFATAGTLTGGLSDLAAAQAATAAAVVSAQAEIDAAVADLADEISRATSAEGAIVADLAALETSVSGNTAAISSLAVTVADGDAALAALITTLDSAVDANAAAISTEAATRADAVSALAGRTTTLEARATPVPNLLVNGDFSEGVSGWPSGGLTPAYDPSIGSYAFSGSFFYSDTYSASPGMVLSIGADMAPDAGAFVDVRWLPGGEVAARAYAVNWVTRARSDGSSVAAPSGTTGWFVVAAAGSAAQVALSRIKVNIGAVAADWTDEASSLDRAARLTVTEVALTTAESAIASLETELAAEIGAVEALISDEAIARASADDALAATITTLEAEVDANAASIVAEASTRATAIDALAARTLVLEASTSGGNACADTDFQDPDVWSNLYSNLNAGATVATYYGVEGGVRIVRRAVTGTPTTGQANFAQGGGPWLLRVEPGDRIEASGRIATSGMNCQVAVSWFSLSFSYLGTSTAATFAGSGSAWTSDPNGVERQGGFVIAPSGAVFASLDFVGFATGATDPSYAVGEPLIRHASADQVELTPFEPGTDRTSSARLSVAEASIATAESAIASLETDLLADIGDLDATVSIHAAAIADLEANDAIAVYEVEAVASGGNPARIRLASSSLGAAVALDGDQIWFGAETRFDNTHDVFITDVGGNRLITHGPFGASNDLLIWKGADSVAPNAATPANGTFALTTSGALYRNGKQQSALYSETAQAVPSSVTSSWADVITFTVPSGPEANKDRFSASIFLDKQTTPSVTRSNSSSVAPGGDFQIVEQDSSGTTATERVVLSGTWSSSIIGAGVNAAHVTEFDVAGTVSPWAHGNKFTFKWGAGGRFVLRMRTNGSANLLVPIVNLRLDVDDYA